MTTIFNIWATLTGVWLLFATYRSSMFGRQLPQLAEIEIPEGFPWPKVSLIVPACNEGETLESAARSLLSMDYPNLEFIFVNDRSTDGTGAIINALAAKDSRVHPIHIAELPSGWLGKVNALATGAKLATGEWILVTDADVHFSSQCLKKAVFFAEKRGLDFLTVFPTVTARTRMLKIFLLHFAHLLTIIAPLNQVKGTRGGGFVGLGVFLFMRREVLARSEGFEWIRLEVLDDTGIAYMMKRAGAEMGAVGGYDELELEWYANVPAFVRGVEKNIFAALSYSVVLLIASVSGNFLATGGMLIAPFFASSLWFGVGVWLAFALCLTTFALRARKIMPIRVWEVYLTPLAFFAFPLIAIRSAVITLKNGGVRWRTSFYPLAELRAHQRINILKILRQRRG